MFAYKDPLTIYQKISAQKAENLSIGFVPTMGFLHSGHGGLIEKSKKENDITVVSIFVNPTQFNNDSDLRNYPRDLEADKVFLEKMEVDYLFVPNDELVFKEKPRVSIKSGDLADGLEGKYRPGHFEGVALIVAKMLNFVAPNRAYFGLKDLQQFLIIKQLVQDLSFPVEIVGVDTQRLSSGLAMSSRNARLTSVGKKLASCLKRGLDFSKTCMEKGYTPTEVKAQTIDFYASSPGLDIEYFEVVSGVDLKPLQNGTWPSEVAFCVAGYVEGVRLIDNLYLRLKN